MLQAFEREPAWLQLLKEEARRIEESLTSEEREAAEKQPEPAPDELDVLLQEAALLLILKDRRIDAEIFALCRQEDSTSGEESKNGSLEVGTGTICCNRANGSFDDVDTVRAAAAPGKPGKEVIELKTKQERYRVSFRPAVDGKGGWLVVIEDTLAKDGRVIVLDRDSGERLLVADLNDGVASGMIGQLPADLSRLRFRTETQ